MNTYTVFGRSATNFAEFARAHKSVIRCGLTEEEARRMCAEFNDNRTPAQVRKGTKYEYTRE